MNRVDSPVQTHRRGKFLLSTDRSLVDANVVHAFLTEAYWSKGIPRETVERAIRNSLCFAILDGSRQVGFARVISDFATYAYLADVFVIEEYRGRGLSSWLMECIVAHPDLQGLRRWTLATRDAHGLYAKYGFTPLAAPDRFMERHNPTVYAKAGLSETIKVDGAKDSHE
jgi:N-acetylglutamate synthase-like GNAT family acetyltransferase